MPEELKLRPVEILLAEDSVSDAHLTQLVFRDSKVRNRVSVVDDGVQAMMFLLKQQPYTNAPRPDIIVLDINMPRKNGLETLAEIRQNEDFNSIPVVMLSVSQSERDVAESYLHHANCYIVKPIDLSGFVEIVTSIEKFWFSIVTLPQRQLMSE